MDTKLADLTRAIQGNGAPAPDNPDDPFGFRSRIIRIANDLYNTQRPDRRARLIAGDELMALAEEMGVVTIPNLVIGPADMKEIEREALEARRRMHETPIQAGGPEMTINPRDKPAHLETSSPLDTPNADGPVSNDPSSQPAQHEKARA